MASVEAKRRCGVPSSGRRKSLHGARPANPASWRLGRDSCGWDSNGGPTLEPIFVKNRLRYPLREALFLVTCASVAGCDDYDEIAERRGKTTEQTRYFISSAPLTPDRAAQAVRSAR